MASTLVQFRTDDISKQNAVDICQTMGIELQDYLRMCVSRLISERGIPFSMNADEIIASRAKAAMRKASLEAEAIGISEMSLDDINGEIAATRKSKEVKAAILSYFNNNAVVMTPKKTDLS